MKNILKATYIILGVIALLVITTWTVTALQKQVKIDRENQTEIIEVIKSFDSDIPCQNLDVLDSVDDILHWEIINDTLHIYTKKDSIRDEHERWKYIDSLYKADDAYDKWMNEQ